MLLSENDYLFGSMQSRELMQMNYTAAAETLVRSWNDIAVEVLI